MLPDIAPTFVARLGGQAFTNWTSMSVSRSMERMSGEFHLELTRQAATKDSFLGNAVLPGAAAQIEVGGKVILVGWVDEVKIEGDAKSDKITVSGRDKTGDLIDCAARVDSNFDFINQTLDKVVAQIIKPFGLKLTVSAPVGPAFQRLSVQPGETAFEFIERACRFRQVLILSDGIGGVALVKPHSQTSPGKLVYGVNALTRDVDLDEKEVFSLYVVRGNIEPLANDSDLGTDALAISVPEGRATDSLMKRYRPKVIISENQGYNLTFAQRAQWEKTLARARSKKATYTVQGWYADAKAKVIWQPNSVVRVTDLPSGLDRNMLITGVSFTRDEGGTKTAIDLAIPEAFDLLPERGPTNNLTWAADND